MKLRKYQLENAEKLCEKLNKYKIAYFAAEVRTGKTLTALQTAFLFGAKNVLFVTKKKAISSIEGDYRAFNFDYDITVINYESLHKISLEFDLLILDESHTLSSYPKPANRTKLIKDKYSDIPVIFLTGTPAIESGSQWYHQFYVSDYSPFRKYRTFYKWAKEFVSVIQKDFGFGKVNDYSKADRQKINEVIYPYLLTFTQEESGFTTTINEKVLYCEIKTKSLSDKLIKDKVIEGKTDLIIADTAVKLQNKVHQILNGTCILESGKYLILDTSKAEFIRDYFKGKKLALFYYYKAELELLKSTFTELTTELEEFNNTDKHIAIQQTSSEGLNLSKADCIVFYNFGFSGKNYVQSRDRLTTIKRKNNDVYFVFGKGGINSKIYDRVKNKMDYNSKIFKKDYGI